tara:strand:+ start:59 stop:310 length:252 start_codon:yes stop_codon:yes gene_type:complete
MNDQQNRLLPSVRGSGPCVALAKQGPMGPQPQAAVKRWRQTPPRVARRPLHHPSPRLRAVTLPGKPGRKALCEKPDRPGEAKP